jgi:hypothetical protein
LTNAIPHFCRHVFMVHRIYLVLDRSLHPSCQGLSKRAIRSEILAMHPIYECHPSSPAN